MRLKHHDLMRQLRVVLTGIDHTAAKAKGARYSVTIRPENGTGPAKQVRFSGTGRAVLHQATRWREEHDSAAA